ncbi:unnamed protein product [Arabis nemorensis]|uniref:Uncharacterized protein n=1 Tax=Arabis nemorensis TaxID=586526 RepID=A0A565B6N1_9BRAS|nr:unnamed protein product [Arabis nemorensis]
MASPANFRCSKPSFNLQINLHRKFTKKIVCPPFSRDLTKSTLVRYPIIKASSSSSPTNPKPSLVKTTCITLTAAAALFAASSFYFASKPTPVTTTAEEATLEKHLETESNDVEALLSLTKIKFESKKYDQAIEILNRLIEIDPDEQKWPVMKARILSLNFQSESAIKAFEEILSKDPDRIDAYHYLVMEYFDSKPKLAELEKRISDAIERCKTKTKEIRSFRMLIALIKVMEGNPVEAIRISEELVKDDPEDYMTYMFQGLVYTLMKKEDDAAKQFEQCACILPENHPYRENAEDISEWSLIVAYDEFLCYFMAFTKLTIASSFGLIGKFVA